MHHSPYWIRFLFGAWIGLAIAAGTGAEPASQGHPGQPTGTVLVQLASGVDPRAAADALGAELVGPVGGLEATWVMRPYLLQARAADSRSPDWDPAAFDWVVSAEAEYYEVLENWSEWPVGDGLFSFQWHLVNAGQNAGTRGEDLNVVPAWERGWTGVGSVIAIIDDGIDREHPNLAPNLLLDTSRRSGLWREIIGSNDATHGTSVGGLAAAAPADLCGVGVAYESGLVDLPLLQGRASTSDVVEALWSEDAGLRATVDIYNNSWGPGGGGSAGVRLASVSDSAVTAIRTGTREGRGGLGSIYVWASGNRRSVGGNANYDGYNRLPETISVGAVGRNGQATDYSNPGANLFVAAPSGDSGVGITTTDRTGSLGNSPGDCTTGFSGTSAATPLVSGVVALMLDANPELGWRDVQHILARTAVQSDLDASGWATNGAGYPVHHDFGFGRVDAHGAGALAEQWERVPEATAVESGTIPVSRSIPINRGGRLESYYVQEDIRLEHVEVTLNLSHDDWGHLRAVLISPSGTVSVLMEQRNDTQRSYSTWRFMSVRNWGESSQGEWLLRIQDNDGSIVGTMDSWSLRLHGTPREPDANRPPVAEGLALTADELPMRIDPLENDSDPDGDSLSILSLYQPRHGFAEITEDGLGIRYDALPDHRGVDRMGYTVWDGRDGVAKAFITIDNPLPGAVPDRAVTAMGASVTIDVLENDINLGAGEPMVFLEKPPSRGTIAVLGNGRFRYDPVAGFFGSDTFSYRVRTAEGLEDTAAATIFVAREPRFALQFRDAGDVLNLGTESALNLTQRLTFEAWIHPTDWGRFGLAGFGRIFDKENVLFFLNGRDHVLYPDASLIFFVRQGEALEDRVLTSPEAAVRLDEWQHVAVSYDGAGGVRFFVNGVETGVRTTSQIDPPTGTIGSHANHALRIGNSAEGTRSFIGLIGDVRIWNRLLLPEELAIHRTEPLTGDEPGLVGYWPMAEGSGNNTANPVPGGKTGRLEGAVWAPWALPGMPEYLEVEESIFTGASMLERNWWLVPWLGWIFSGEFPFVWVEPFGWTFPVDTADDGLWMYLYPDNDWIYTNPTVFPSHFRNGLQEWVDE